MKTQKNKLINILNNNTNFGLKKFYIRKTNEILKYLNILYKEGVILSFVVKTEIVIITTHNNSISHINDQIQILSKKRVKNNKKYKDLVKYSCGLQMLYLSTSYGILSIKDAKLKGVGGYPFILV